MNKRVLVTAIFGVIMAVLVVYVITDYHQNTSNQAAYAASEEARKAHEEKDKEAELTKKADAEKEIYTILNNTNFEYDQVDREYKFYSSSQRAIQPSNAVSWVAFVDSSGHLVGPFIKLVTFAPLDISTNWIFWDKLTFSSSAGKYDYTMRGVIAGQSGGGKNIRLDDSGAYEYALLTIPEIDEGMRILTQGSNPIIRYRGSQYYKDYTLSSEEIEQLKTALTLYKLGDIVDNTLDVNKLSK
jgi:hypothetical protein|nr:MAG TPA: hypothetical protein [Caudoviricetes sp.]